MRIYFGNLPDGTTTEDLLSCFSSFIYRDIDRNSALIDGNSGFVECSRFMESLTAHKNEQKWLDSEVKSLDGKLLNGKPIVVRWEKPNEFGQFLVSKIEKQKKYTDYTLSNNKIKEHWEELVECGLIQIEDTDYIEEEDSLHRRLNRLSMPSFLQELKLISQKFEMNPIFVEQDFIAAIFSVPYARQVMQFDVYEAMSNSEATLFIHAFVKDKLFRMKCWSAIVVSNHNGKTALMPAGYSWRENFDRFLMDIRGMITTVKKNT